MASFSIPCPTSSASLASRHRGRLRSASASASKLVHGFFGRSPPGARSKLQFVQQLSSYPSRCRCQSRVPRANALSNEGSAAGAEADGDAAKKEPRLPDAPSISAFMNQVADLVEGFSAGDGSRAPPGDSLLVDSRDVVELQLKQADCEVTIRKKGALQQPPVAAPVYMGPPPSPQHLFPPQPPVAPVLPPATSKPVPSMPTPAAPAVKPSTPSHPPLKCPMAGTFYRSPAPGAPPFVKDVISFSEDNRLRINLLGPQVGDKVQKGQVVCIIEAMKLMNEIEADQSGTVVEILVEDAKPVSLDTPLFIIAP